MLNDADAQLLALRHYRSKWYGRTWDDSLKADWQTEYNAVSSGAFASILFTATGMEGGSSATAQRNFEQTARVAALQAFRAQNDADYAAAIFGDIPQQAAPPSVMYPIFPANFAH